MALAETAELAVRLTLKDGLSAPISQVQSKLGGLNRATSGLTGALGHAGGKLKGLITGPFGLIGLVGGVAGVTAALSTAIGRAEDFGQKTEELAKVTGLSADAASRLVDALDFYGISAETQLRVAGLYEKNLARVAKTSKDAANFEKQYGLAITDSKGSLLDYNAQLKKSADFFNDKTIPAQKKSAALAALYGRSWQDLLPILARGSDGIQKATDEAMHLTDAQLAAILKSKEATRAWNDALGDLSTEIGIDLLPAVTDMARTLTKFVNDHSDDIRAFFRNGVDVARKAAEGAAGVVSAIAGAWDKIPAPVRDILVRGVVAERSIKFLFGVSPTNLAGDIFGTIGKQLFSKGGSPANPLWVASVNGGVGGGGIPGLPGVGGTVATAAGGIGAAGLGTLAVGIGGILGAYYLPEILKGPEGTTDRTPQNPIAYAYGQIGVTGLGADAKTRSRMTGDAIAPAVTQAATSAAVAAVRAMNQSHNAYVATSGRGAYDDSANSLRLERIAGNTARLANRRTPASTIRSTVNVNTTVNVTVSERAAKRTRAIAASHVTGHAINRGPLAEDV